MTEQTDAPAPGISKPIMADPTPLAFGLFGFALLIYGARFVNVDDQSLVGASSDALNYAVLFAGVGHLIAGVLAFIRGMNYPAWIISVFGTWLVGFFFLSIHTDGAAAADPKIMTAGDGSALPEAVVKQLAGANTTAWHTNSLAWYVLALIIPVLILEVPAILIRNIPLIVTFAGLVVLLLMLGLAFHGVYSELTDVVNAALKGHQQKPDLGGSVTMLKVSAWAGFVSGVSMLFIFATTMYKDLGIIGKKG